MDRKEEAEALIGGRREQVWVELPGREGSIPVITVRGETLAEAWELSLLALYGWGAEMRTEYDRRSTWGRYEDPPSLDCTMRMIIVSPLSEPMIHRAFPGGLDDLEEYRQEVLEGIKDHWIRDPSDPADQRWEYTYHERLTSYRVPGLRESFDQLHQIVEGLVKNPHSRRQQAITWKVWEDAHISDPACLQSLWFRVLPDENDVWHLNMNVRFRSRDAYDAAFMNCFALALLMEQMARELAGAAGREVQLGRYVDESDSYHLYGRRRTDFQSRFLRQVSSRSFEERTWTREFAEPFFDEARPRIAEKIRRHDEERKRPR